jgi:FtsH-binding integral membrane protein
METFPTQYNDVMAEQPLATRTEFIKKTYWHLSGAIAAFAFLEILLQKLGLGEASLQIIGTSKFSWLIVLAGFMFVSWIANSWAQNSTSLTTQYLGLGIYVVAEAVIFLPLIAMAKAMDPNIIGQAATVTLALVLAITTVAFTLKKDFSFLGGFLRMAGFLAIGVVIASFFLPITLGFWFSAAMVLFAGGCVLYDTSNIMYHYRPNQHVAASLSLFASVALMFWYILRMFMNRD